MLSIKLCGENKPQSIGSRGSSSTRVKQTYRFDRLLDDGSYTISIENISGNIKLRGHEGSGAKLTLTKIAHGIPENEIDEVHKLARAFITHFENEELILISGSDKNPYKGTAENVFELEFPKNINLNFQLLGGDIDIFNINGELILETDNKDDFLMNMDLPEFKMFYYRTAHYWYFNEKSLTGSLT